jgi:hypothetical protein
MVKLLRLYSDYGEAKLLAAVSVQSGQEISIQQIEAQLLTVESATALNPHLEIKVEHPELERYNGLLQGRLAV